MTALAVPDRRFAERPGGLWDYVSPSRLALWCRCPLAFKLKYVDGLEPRMTAGLFTGRMVHSGLERWYRHRQLRLEIAPVDVVDWVSKSWCAAGAAQKVAYRSITEEQESCSQALGLLTEYFRHIPADESRPLAVEAPLSAPLVDPTTGVNLGLPLVGIVDLVLDEPTGGLVIDFKTAARGGELFEITHEIQLTSYSFLHRQTHHRPEAGLEIRRLIKTKTPKVDHHRFPPRSGPAFRRLFTLIREYLDALDRGRFTIRPSWGCGLCEFRNNRCRDWEG